MRFGLGVPRSRRTFLGNGSGVSRGDRNRNARLERDSLWCCGRWPAVRRLCVMRAGGGTVRGNGSTPSRDRFVVGRRVMNSARVVTRDNVLSPRSCRGRRPERCLSCGGPPGRLLAAGLGRRAGLNGTRDVVRSGVDIRGAGGGCDLAGGAGGAAVRSWRFRVLVGGTGDRGAACRAALRPGQQAGVGTSAPASRDRRPGARLPERRRHALAVDMLAEPWPRRP